MLRQDALFRGSEFELMSELEYHRRRYRIVNQALEKSDSEVVSEMTEAVNEKHKAVTSVFSDLIWWLWVFSIWILSMRKICFGFANSSRDR